jgi:hypothetical protein
LMSDTSIIPITDEQAKMIGDAIGAGRAAGRYMADILGDLPKDCVGWLFGDRMKVRRAERLAELYHGARKRLEEQGIKDPEPPSLNVALPILIGAADESREELQDLWKRLLAAAMHPRKSRFVRLRFAEAVQRLDPTDALVLDYLQRVSGHFSHSDRSKVAAEIGISVDELLVSMATLSSVALAGEYNSMMSGLLPLGREFLRAIAD